MDAGGREDGARVVGGLKILPFAFGDAPPSEAAVSLISGAPRAPTAPAATDSEAATPRPAGAFTAPAGGAPASSTSSWGAFSLRGRGPSKLLAHKRVHSDEDVCSDGASGGTVAALSPSGDADGSGVGVGGMPGRASSPTGARPRRRKKKCRVHVTPGEIRLRSDFEEIGGMPHRNYAQLVQLGDPLSVRLLLTPPGLAEGDPTRLAFDCAVPPRYPTSAPVVRARHPGPSGEFDGPQGPPLTLSILHEEWLPVKSMVDVAKAIYSALQNGVAVEDLARPRPQASIAGSEDGSLDGAGEGEWSNDGCVEGELDSLADDFTSVTSLYTPVPELEAAPGGDGDDGMAALGEDGGGLNWGTSFGDDEMGVDCEPSAGVPGGGCVVGVGGGGHGGRHVLAFRSAASSAPVRLPHSHAHHGGACANRPLASPPALPSWRSGARVAGYRTHS